MSQGGDWAWIVGAGSVVLMAAGCAGMLGVGLMRGVEMPELEVPTPTLPQPADISEPPSTSEDTLPLTEPAEPVEPSPEPSERPETRLQPDQGLDRGVEILAAAYGQGLIWPEATLSVSLDGLCAQGIAAACNQPRGLQSAPESTLTVNCHDQNDALSCLVLGWKLTQRDARGRPHRDRHDMQWVALSDVDVEDTPRDIEGADAFHQGCAQRDPRSCAELGRLYGWGIGRAHDPERATELFEAACGAGDALACSWWGDRFVESDPQQALALYTRACEGGSGEGCRNQYALTEGEGRNAILEGGCLEHQDGRACTWHSQNQVEQELDPDAGIARLELLCDGAGAQVGLAYPCDLLAGYALNGVGMPSNAAWAVELNRKGCDAGDPAACAHLAYRYDDGRGVAADPRQALRHLRMACDADFAEGCRSLAELRYSSELDDPPAPDNSEALPAMKRACELDDGEACNRLAIIYTSGLKGAPVQEDLVADLHAQSCELGFAWGCFNHAWWDDQGDKGKEPWAAARLLQSCELGLGEGCEAYADRLAEGRGVDGDAGAAAAYRAKACELGTESACEG